jgi:hypothetical protein
MPTAVSQRQQACERLQDTQQTLLVAAAQLKITETVTTAIRTLPVDVTASDSAGYDSLQWLHSAGEPVDLGPYHT